MDLISTFPALPLTWECTVVFEARDPSTGEPVSGVVIDNPVLYGLNLTAQAAAGTPSTPVGPFMLVPGPAS
jgi:hypothetical protein